MALLAILVCVSAAGDAEITVAERSPLAEETALGTPIVAYTLWTSVVARHPEDGRALLVTGTWSAGGNAPVLVFDPKRKTVDRVVVDAQGTYGITPGSDGWVYIGTVSDAALYRYHLVSKKLEKLGRPSPSESWLYNLLVIDSRYVLGGTFGGGRLAGLDLRDNKLIDFGAMDPPERYVCATAPGPDGTVYCGTGSRAGLIHFDPATGEKKDILPSDYSENSFAYTLRRDGQYLYASVIFDNRILIFDTRTDRLVHDFGKGSSMLGTEGEVWVAADGVTGRWDVEGETWAEKRSLPANARDVTADGIVFAYKDGVFAAVEFSSGDALASAEVGHGGDGQSIFTLHTGPDGAVYGSSYNLHHIFRVDPETGATADLGNPIPPQSGEVYAFTNDGTQMYMASYTHARLSVYDTGKAWDPGANPRLLGELGREQYRTPGLTMGPDGALYVGSTPAYGKIGGALSVYDPESEKIEVFRNVIPGQSVNCLAGDRRRGWVLGGSSIQVGLGVDPVDTDAHLFAWDCEQETLVHDFIPLPGNGTVNHILLVPDGTVLTASGSRLVHSDVEAEEVLQAHSWPGGAITAMRFLDGDVYINSGNGLFLFDCDAGRATKIASGGSSLALDRRGHAYYARGPELFRVSIGR